MKKFLLLPTFSGPNPALPPEEAIRRELKEELGIELINLKFFKKYKLQRKRGIYEQFVFTAPLNYPLENLKKRQKESKDLALFTYEGIKNLKMADYTREILKDFFKSVTKNIYKKNNQLNLIYTGPEIPGNAPRPCLGGKSRQRAGFNFFHRVADKINYVLAGERGFKR